MQNEHTARRVQIGREQSPTNLTISAEPTPAPRAADNIATQLQTGIAPNGFTWGASQWFDLYLCGEKVGTFVGTSRAIQNLESIARNRGIDLRAARAAYLQALQSDVTPVSIPAVTCEATITPNTETAPATAKQPLRAARQRCMAIVGKSGFTTDSARMRAASLNYFGWFHKSRTEWTAEKWTAFADAVEGGVWKPDFEGGFVRVHNYSGTQPQQKAA